MINKTCRRCALNPIEDRQASVVHLPCKHVKGDKMIKRFFGSKKEIDLDVVHSCVDFQLDLDKIVWKG